MWEAELAILCDVRSRSVYKGMSKLQKIVGIGIEWSVFWLGENNWMAGNRRVKSL